MHFQTPFLLVAGLLSNTILALSLSHATTAEPAALYQRDSTHWEPMPLVARFEMSDPADISKILWAEVDINDRKVCMSIPPGFNLKDTKFFIHKATGDKRPLDGECGFFWKPNCKPELPTNEVKYGAKFLKNKSVIKDGGLTSFFCDMTFITKQI